MLKIIMMLSLLLPLGANAAWEDDITLGFNLDTHKEDLPGQYDLKSEYTPGGTIGYKTVGKWGNIGLRTGAFLEFKRVNLKDRNATADKDDIELTAFYAAVPINLQIDLHDRWWIFGGITPRMLLTKTCENCGRFDDDDKIFVNYANAGIGYKFGRKFSMEGNFNQALDENFKDLKINTAQVLFHYDI